MLVTPKIEFFPEMANGSKDPMQNISGIRLVVFQLSSGYTVKIWKKHNISSTGDPQGKIFVLENANT